MSSASAAMTASGVTGSLRPSRSVNPSRIRRVASSPTSAISSRVSSSSSSASSRRLPPRNRAPRPSASPARVLLRPARTRPSQLTRGAGCSTGTSTTVGAGGAGGAGAGSGACSTGACAGFGLAGSTGATGATTSEGATVAASGADSAFGSGAGGSGETAGSDGSVSRSKAAGWDALRRTVRRRRSTSAATRLNKASTTAPRPNKTPCSSRSHGIHTRIWASHSRTWIIICSTRSSCHHLGNAGGHRLWAAMLPPGPGPR